MDVPGENPFEYEPGPEIGPRLSRLLDAFRTTHTPEGVPAARARRLVGRPAYRCDRGS